VAPICTPSNTCLLGPIRVHILIDIWIGSTTADNPYTLQWATPSPPLKIALLHGESEPPCNTIHGSLGPPKCTIQATSHSVQQFLQCRAHNCDSDKPSRPTQPPTLSRTGNEYQPKCGDALHLGVKGRYVSFHLWINAWVVVKTVRSLVNMCHTRWSRDE